MRKHNNFRHFEDVKRVPKISKFDIFYNFCSNGLKYYNVLILLTLEGFRKKEVSLLILCETDLKSVGD